MANLNKLLVHVPSSLCEDFRNKYIKDGANRDKSYDNKVVFLEDTKEIFTKGKTYGISIKDFNDLKKIVGTIPSGGGTTSTNIVDYINEKFGKLGTAAYKMVSDFDGAGAAADVKRELLGGESDKYTYNTIYGAKAYTYDAYNRIIGSENDAYTAYTIYGLRRYAIYQAQSYSDNVALSMPEVTAGTGIIVNESTVPPHGKKIYTVSTSAELFHYKGNKTTITQLPSTGNTRGDVWSVGPANATETAGSTLYVWDGDEWINLGSAHGVSNVDTTRTSCGVALTKNAGVVGVDVKTGAVAYDVSYVVTGGAVYSYINNLGGNASSGNTSSYVNVTVNTSGGKAKEVIVTDTPALKNAVSYANSALQKVDILGYTLSKNSYSITAKQVKDKLGLGEAAYEDISYFNTYFATHDAIETVTQKIESVENVIQEINDLNIDNIFTNSYPYINIDIDNDNYTTPHTISYYINLDETEIFNYVANNIWETYPQK